MSERRAEDAPVPSRLSKEQLIAAVMMPRSSEHMPPEPLELEDERAFGPHWRSRDEA